MRVIAFTLLVFLLVFTLTDWCQIESMFMKGFAGFVIIIAAVLTCPDQAKRT